MKMVTLISIQDIMSMRKNNFFYDKFYDKFVSRILAFQKDLSAKRIGILS